MVATTPGWRPKHHLATMLGTRLMNPLSFSGPGPLALGSPGCLAELMMPQFWAYHPIVVD